MVVISHGKNHKICVSVSLKFRKLNRYNRSDMIRKSSLSRLADILLNDCTPQWGPVVLASNGANPSCKLSAPISVQKYHFNKEVKKCQCKVAKHNQHCLHGSAASLCLKTEVKYLVHQGYSNYIPVKHFSKGTKNSNNAHIGHLEWEMWLSF